MPRGNGVAVKLLIAQGRSHYLGDTCLPALPLSYLWQLLGLSRTLWGALPSRRQIKCLVWL